MKRCLFIVLLLIITLGCNSQEPKKPKAIDPDCFVKKDVKSMKAINLILDPKNRSKFVYYKPLGNEGFQAIFLIKNKFNKFYEVFYNGDILDFRIRQVDESLAVVHEVIVWDAGPDGNVNFGSLDDDETKQFKYDCIEPSLNTGEQFRQQFQAKYDKAIGVTINYLK